jgi:hypothetical protein
MGILDDQLACDAANIFCDPDEFGEAVTYTNSGGAWPINVQVSRDDTQAIPGLAGPGVVSKAMQVFIPNGAGGITAIDQGSDTIALPERQGGPAVVRRVKKILRQDAGGWCVEL